MYVSTRVRGGGESLRGPCVECPTHIFDCFKTDFGSDGVTLVPLEVRGGMAGRVWVPVTDGETLAALDVRGGMGGREWMPVTDGETLVALAERGGMGGR